MTNTTIVPTERELKEVDLTNPEVRDLVRQAQESDAADRSLKVFEALKKYKKAVFWAMFLSTSLIMEGYDVVIVSIPHQFASFCLHQGFRSPRSTARHNSRIASVSLIWSLARDSSRQLGNRASRTLLLSASWQGLSPMDSRKTVLVVGIH